MSKNLPDVKASEILIDNNGKVVINNSQFAEALKAKLETSRNIAESASTSSLFDNCNCTK